MPAIFSPRRFLILCLCALVSLGLSQMRHRIEGDTSVSSVSTSTSYPYIYGRYGKVFIATSERAYDELVEADEVSITDLMLKRSVVSVPRGTQVQILIDTPYDTQVQLVAGPLKGLIGWVSPEGLEQLDAVMIHNT